MVEATRPGWHESPSLTALREALEAAALMRGTIARSAGLSESELRTLEHLVRTPLGPADLARRLGVSTAAVTGILDRLEGRDHLERAPHPDDRRRTALTVTDSGRQEIRGHLAPMFLALQQLDDAFDPAEREVVARYLRDVTAAFDRIAQGATGTDDAPTP
ncbi:MarR family winged helix-turn-helix transcriptional regulator [Nocardioides stalactiti]|uniref:MarR family winged helix-turn-helix transcriptional regulator n=1 Tax=Nocardioides stalactiti TaxID=2755356 RepID=UPI001FE9C0F9|nr:MarR family transcriptional regulator [Nocardioides stalactiti]